jgi:hypothetical protein
MSATKLSLNTLAAAALLLLAGMTAVYLTSLSVAEARTWCRIGLGIGLIASALTWLSARAAYVQPGFADGEAKYLVTMTRASMAFIACLAFSIVVVPKLPEVIMIIADLALMFVFCLWAMDTFELSCGEVSVLFLPLLGVLAAALYFRMGDYAVEAWSLDTWLSVVLGAGLIVGFWGIAYLAAGNMSTAKPAAQAN